LRNRAKLALHAVVGLDVQQREVVEKVLLEGLQGGKAPEEQQTDIALVIALGDPSPPAAATAARVLAQAMGKTPDPVALLELAEGLAGVASRLELGEAAQAARTLTQAMGKTADPGALRELAEGLAAVAARLEPGEAARHCAQAASAITQAMSKTTDH